MELINQDLCCQFHVNFHVSLQNLLQKTGYFSSNRSSLCIAYLIVQGGFLTCPPEKVREWNWVKHHLLDLPPPPNPIFVLVC